MKFLYPIPLDNAIVTQTFEQHEERRKRNGWTNYNGGIDWAIVTGTPVTASQGGKVTVARDDVSGYGRHVRIQHKDDYLTIYGHMLSFEVAQGDVVRAGDLLGLSDNTGMSTGPHIHFELRKNGVAIDPAPLLVHTLTEDEEEPVEPEPPTENEFSGLVFPKAPEVEVVVGVLNIRLAPGAKSRDVGDLYRGSKVSIFEFVEDQGNFWAKIGHNQYIAVYFGGEPFVKLVK